MKFVAWFENNFLVRRNYSQTNNEWTNLILDKSSWLMCLFFVFLIVDCLFYKISVVSMKIYKKEFLSAVPISKYNVKENFSDTKNYTRNNYNQSYFEGYNYNSIMLKFNNTYNSNTGISVNMTDDKVDADINILDKKLENLSKMLENLENIRSTARDNKTYSLDPDNTNNSKESLITMLKNPINLQINHNNTYISKIDLDKNKTLLTHPNIIQLNNTMSFSCNLVVNSSALSNNTLFSDKSSNENVKKTQNEIKEQQYHSILLQSLAMFEEISMNSDQRKKRSILRMYFISNKSFLIVSLLIYLYLILTWKLSQKNNKFPASIIYEYFISNLFLVLFIYLSHMPNKNLLFQKIGMTSILLLNYNNIFLNLLYFSSVIFISKCRNNSEIHNCMKSVEKIKILFYLLLCFAFVKILYYSNMQIKNCFIGFCMVDRKQRNYLQLIPKKIEIFVMIFLFGYYFIMNAIVDYKSPSSKKFPEIENENEMNTDTYLNSHYTNNDFRFYNFLNNLVRKNNSIQKIILLEICYLFYTFVNYMTEYYKFFYYNHYRYEDYSSIHDYYIITNSFLFLFFMGLNKNDFIEWQKAFQSDGLEEENKTADELIAMINKLKLSISHSTIK